MKIFKRIVAATMTLCMGIGLCGCSGKQDAQNKSYDIKHGDEQYFVMNHYQTGGGALLDMEYTADQAIILDNDNGNLKYLSGTSDSDIWDETIIDDIDENKDKAYISAGCIDTDGTAYSAVYNYDMKNNEMVDGSTEIRRYDMSAGQKSMTEHEVIMENIDLNITGMYHSKEEDSYYFLTSDGLFKYDSTGKQVAEYDESGCRNFAVADKVYLLADQKMVELDKELNVVSESSGLYDSLKSEIEDTIATADSSYSVGKKILKTDDENNIYILTDKALYKKATGSEEITIILDDTDGYESGTNTALQAVLCGDRYMTIDSEHYISVYAVNDGTVKPVKKQEITLWSLRYATFVEQAVDTFNNKSNSITVKYEYGVSDDNGVSIKDAINSLNTELLSGKGPDVILTDGLNINSYIDNGAFLDLADLETEIQKKYSNCLDKVMDTYRVGDKVYAIPSRVTFQAVVEPKDITGSLNYISDFQDYIDYSEPPKEGNDLDICDWTLLFEIFYPQYVNDFIRDKSFDTETFKTFLDELHTLWKTLKSRTPEERLTKWNEEKNNDGYERQFSRRVMPLVNYEYFGQSVSVGSIEYVSTIKFIDSYKMDKDGEEISIRDNYDYRALVHNNGVLYVPIATFAINSNTDKISTARKFVMGMFSDEPMISNKSDPYYVMGVPVNLDSIKYEDYVLSDGGKTTPGGGGQYGGYWCGSVDVFESEVMQNECFEILKSLDTPVKDDIQVRNIIEEGIDDYMNDKKSLDDTVKDIDNQLGIYFSE